MKKAKAIIKKSVLAVLSAYAGHLRKKEDESLRDQIYKRFKKLPNQKKSIGFVLLPGSDISGKALSRFLCASSMSNICFFVDYPDDASFKTINEAILKSGYDYIVLLNDVYDLTSCFDKILVSEFEKRSNAGIIGFPSYYSPASGRTRSNLIKQEGIYTEKRNHKDSAAVDYSVKAKNSLKTNWMSSEDASETIPSTDLLAMSLETFRKIGGFSDFYNVNYMTFPMADLCLSAKAAGFDNYLIKSCLCCANSAESVDTDAKRTNREVFRGRWQRFLENGGNIKEGGAALDPMSIDICGPMPDNDTAKSWGDYHYALALKKAFEKQGYKANVLSREHWYDESDSKYVLILRGLRPYYKSPVGCDQKLMYWAISHPAEITAAELNQCDHIFYPSELMADHFKGSVDVPSSILPQCTDPEVMKNEDTCSMTPELLFIGNSRHIFRRILKDLLPTDHELKVYGRHWDEYPMVKEHVVAEYLDNSRISTAYHNAAILLNDHWDDMLEFGIISNRIFDALSSGAFVISDEVAGIHEMLGDSVVTYKDPADLKNKIDYYLEHKDERDRIASKGHDIVIANHTFDARANHIIEKMGSETEKNVAAVL